MYEEIEVRRGRCQDCGERALLWNEGGRLRWICLTAMLVADEPSSLEVTVLIASPEVTVLIASPEVTVLIEEPVPAPPKTRSRRQARARTRSSNAVPVDGLPAPMGR